MVQYKTWLTFKQLGIFKAVVFRKLRQIHALAQEKMVSDRALTEPVCFCYGSFYIFKLKKVCDIRELILLRVTNLSLI